MTAEPITTHEAGTYAEMVAARVRSVAAEKRVTGVALAHRLGISPMAMSRRMTGHIPFAVDELARVAQALGVGIQDLLPEPGEQVTRPYPEPDAFPLPRSGADELLLIDWQWVAS